MKKVLLLFSVNVFFFQIWKKKQKAFPTININKHVSSYSVSLQVLSHLGHSSCECQHWFSLKCFYLIQFNAHKVTYNGSVTLKKRKKKLLSCSQLRVQRSRNTLLTRLPWNTLTVFPLYLEFVCFFTLHD